eukprot:m.604519 g.604519  ORF g.604519 m.604519 type:complete len:579 (-) comp22459_c0_seq17:3152-4888(-)
MGPRHVNFVSIPLLGICTVLYSVHGHGDEDHTAMQMSEACDEISDRVRIDVHSAQFEQNNTDFVVRYSLEVDFMGGGMPPNWKRIAWGDMVLHHHRKSHIVMIGADMDSFGHVHPDDAVTAGIIDEPLGEATEFEAHFGVPVSQKYGLTIAFLADVLHYSNCMATDAFKTPEADPEALHKRRIEYAPVTTITVPPNPQWRTGQLQPEHAFLSTTTTTVGRLASLRYGPDTESMATMVSALGTARACCADTEANGCTSVSMDAQFMYQREAGVESVAAADVSDATLWVPPQTNKDASTPPCLVVRYTFTHPRSGTPLGSLADYLGSPMHLVVATSDRLPADSHVASQDLPPNVIAHYHGGVGSLDFGGDAVGECANVQEYLNDHGADADADGSGVDDIVDNSADAANQIYVAFPSPPPGVYKFFATFNNGDAGGGITLAPFTARIFADFEQRNAYMHSIGVDSVTDVCMDRADLTDENNDGVVPTNVVEDEAAAQRDGSTPWNSHAVVAGVAGLVVVLVVVVIGFVASKLVSIAPASKNQDNGTENNGVTVAGLSITPKRQYQQLPICISDSLDEDELV